MAYETALFDSLRNDRLELRILPTEQCNFRCTYCYETFENKKMPRPVVRGLKALLTARAPTLNELHLDWFGGEPMVAFSIVTDIAQHAQALARTHGFALTGAMTTNGYFLDPANFARCIAHGITHFQISLDGDRDLHDRTRVLGSGAGTFDVIWKNLLAMKDSTADFAVTLRLHFTRRNYSEVGAFAARLHRTFGGDRRFYPFFKAIAQLGGANDADIEPLSSREEQAIRNYLWDASGYGAPPTGQEGYVCYAGKANALVVRSTGRLNKCTVALNSDFNDIGLLNEDGTLSIDQAKARHWIAPVMEGRWDDVGCPIGVVARAFFAESALTPA